MRDDARAMSREARKAPSDACEKSTGTRIVPGRLVSLLRLSTFALAKWLLAFVGFMRSKVFFPSLSENPIVLLRQQLGESGERFNGTDLSRLREIP